MSPSVALRRTLLCVVLIAGCVPEQGPGPGPLSVWVRNQAWDIPIEEQPAELQQVRDLVLVLHIRAVLAYDIEVDGARLSSGGASEFDYPPTEHELIATDQLVPGAVLEPNFRWLDRAGGGFLGFAGPEPYGPTLTIDQYDCDGLFGTLELEGREQPVEVPLLRSIQEVGLAYVTVEWDEAPERLIRSIDLGLSFANDDCVTIIR